MNCQSFENSMTDLARQHPFEAMALREALAHAESCPTCTLRLEEQRALTVGLRSLAEETKRLETPNRVEGRLMEAFREGKLQPQRIHSTTPSWFAVAAIAAVLLIVFGMIGLRLRSVGGVSPETGNQTPLAPLAIETHPKATPAVQPVTSTVVSSQPNNGPRPIARNPRPKLAKHRAKSVRPSTLTAANTSTANADAGPSEVTTEFMPLGDVGLANLQEGAQVIRVEMPRYAMARFGLPVNMERYDERVKADVWVGADGFARAIRFVQ